MERSNFSLPVLLWSVLITGVSFLTGCPGAVEPGVPVFTVRFDTGPEGSALPPQKVREGEKLKKPDSPGNTNRYLEFEDWFIGNGSAGEDGGSGDWKRAWNFDRNTVHEDMTLYARWIESRVRNAGIWWNEYGVYWLFEDGRAWYVDYYGVQHTQWNSAAIGSTEVQFSGEEGGRELTVSGRSSSLSRTPPQSRLDPLGDAAIAGRYVCFNYGASQYTASLELEFDGFGTLRAPPGELPLAYRVQEDMLYLLEREYPHRVLFGFPLYPGYIGDFVKESGSSSLAGVWALKDGGAYTLREDGTGTYHLWGAEMPCAYTVCGDRSFVLGGNRYNFDLFNDTELTVYPGEGGTVRYTRAAAPPPLNPVCGDPALLGTWVYKPGTGEAYTLRFDAQGIMEMDLGGEALYPVIWRAAAGELFTASPDMGSPPAEGGSFYGIENGNLSLFEVTWKKQ